jgi:hypothetical protein
MQSPDGRPEQKVVFGSNFSLDKETMITTSSLFSLKICVVGCEEGKALYCACLSPDTQEGNFINVHTTVERSDLSIGIWTLGKEKSKRVVCYPGMSYEFYLFVYYFPLNITLLLICEAATYS